jgi:hypothetical protein
MLRVLLSTSLAVTLLLTSFLRASASQCSDHEKLSADQKLDILKRPLNRNDRSAVACTVAYMDELSRRGDSRVIPILIQNLDLRLTPDETISLLSPGLHAYGGAYPAMDDICWFTKNAVSPLLDAIAEAGSESLLSQNATKVLMSLQAKDPPAGIKLLLDRAAKEHGRASENLIDAARYAVSLQQCRYAGQACQDALKNGQ